MQYTGIVLKNPPLPALPTLIVAWEWFGAVPDVTAVVVDAYVVIVGVAGPVIVTDVVESYNVSILILVDTWKTVTI